MLEAIPSSIALHKLLQYILCPRTLYSYSRSAADLWILQMIDQLRKHTLHVIMAITIEHALSYLIERHYHVAPQHPKLHNPGQMNDQWKAHTMTTS